MLWAAPAVAQNVVFHERLVGLINPMGAEHMLRAGVRAPLSDSADVLLRDTYVEGGAVNYTSPIYTMNGGYLEVSPLAFLILRAEVSGIFMWPIGMDGGGHYPVEGYSANVGSLPAADGEHAYGWNVQLGGTLQGAVPLGPLRLLMWSQLTLELQSLGTAEHYFFPRFEVVLAREDWMLASSNLVLFEIPLSEGVALRIGAYDDMRYVFRSGYVANQVGPIVALTIENADPAVPEITAFVRAGFNTNGMREAEWGGLAGIMIRYDAGALR